MKCPVCKGKGAIDGPRQDKRERMRYAARVLRKAGFSLWEICRMTGFKSPRGVQVSIKEI